MKHPPATVSKRHAPGSHVDRTFSTNVLQYEDSGHPNGRILPGNSTSASRQRRTDCPQTKTKSALSHELGHLDPPLRTGAGPGDIVDNAESSAVGLRQQHLMAMIATLHRCVLKGDFIRAGRAWGMMLRAEHNGQSLDLRIQDRWGLGAEIVFRRERQLAQARAATDKMSTHSGGEGHQEASNDSLNLKAFEQVRDYYERLVLQYPYRKAYPNVTGPQDFYIAMFNLWIFTIQEQHSLTLADGDQVTAGGQQMQTRPFDKSGSTPISDAEWHSRRQREPVSRTTLRRAEEVAARLEALTMSPPYSNNAKFSELLSMSKKWVSDLSDACNSLRDAEDGEDGEDVLFESLSI